MDSVSVNSLLPLFEDVDKWVEIAPLLPVLISLELVLSADNAIALAAISKSQQDESRQKMALDYGIAIALFLRILLIIAAEWILKYSVFKILAATYLLYIFVDKIYLSKLSSNSILDDSPTAKRPLLSTIIILSTTDLAFSIDSVATAVSISDQYLLVITGAIIGVLALRFTSGLFISWLSIYKNLELSGYIAVAYVAIKLLFSLVFPYFDVPNTFTLLFMILLFIWGFSQKFPDQYV